ncbi:MAG TPA: flagellar type III secretion system pore protein FliP [Frateuria sp.]|uniref:flagellar type III secretion system pore protein FliP n=1 Tax=Frateuria sp. TaxID=2211372 RepID=UPI002DEA44CE|nr:flagellar type III secretion system pore protein FliP [Frateuria sp.]HEV2621272.1 flagellar type III secretion system pore protein FliP [Frateuria sp.]
MSIRGARWWFALALMLLPLVTFAAPQTAPPAPAPLSMPASPASPAGAGIPVLTVHDAPGGAKNWTLSLQLLGLMTVLTLLPAILLMMTSFTRIIIVLGFLRQALGTQSTPPNQVLLGLALFLTMFIMGPVFNKAYGDGVKPYMDGQMTAEQALPAASAPFKRFMLDQTRDADLQLFTRLAREKPYASKDDVPFRVAMPAFLTSELKTAFQMGFLLFIPFLIIDLVVASVLMSMGMMMVSPMIISLPFKIMLFVLVDGWTLLIGTLAGSFYT